MQLVKAVTNRQEYVIMGVILDGGDPFVKKASKQYEIVISDSAYSNTYFYFKKKIDKYFKNAYLFSECIPGYHGENGNKSCGHCLNETACHHVYGMCDTECEPG